jgi:hypothetical protein
MPVLTERFYLLAASRRVAESVFYVDWHMPRSQKNYYLVDQPHLLHGVDGRDRVLWECPMAWQMRSGYNELRHLAVLRGFEIKPTLEFTTWLKKHMQSCPQVQAIGGLHVLAQSLLKRP